MAKLSGKKRKRISTKSFPLPGKRYPIPDKAHARNALTRVSAHGTPTEKARVRKAVARKFPSIGRTSRRKKGGK